MNEQDLRILIIGMREWFNGKSRCPYSQVKERLSDAEKIEFKRIVTDRLHLISCERRRKIVVMRLGLLGSQVYSRKEIAAVEGVSYERIKQLEHDGLYIINRKTPNWPDWLSYNGERPLLYPQPLV